MGMFDTIHFETAFSCPLCGGQIDSVQVKAFENLLEDFTVKDCIGHAEELRIFTEELYCSSCRKFTGKDVYIVVGRGILLGVTESLPAAKELLADLNLEKLLLWYHELYQRYTAEQRERFSYRQFLEDVSEWFGERLHEQPDAPHGLAQLHFLWNRQHLQGALSPLESIDRFIVHKKMREGLDALQAAGQESLAIYYAEDVREGEAAWSVDVYQDELNDRCHLNWTWTVVSKQQLAAEGEAEASQSEWELVVDAPFSDEVVRHAIEQWLRGRGYEFEVRMIALEQARGSGMFKALRAMEVEEEVSEARPLAEFERELAADERKRLAAFIDARADRRRVFYAHGLYGSLVADVETDRLVGKIEGIAEAIIYEGRTVGECEQKFREAVARYIQH